jgi:TDG/mug DNA glycosylase family protein
MSILPDILDPNLDVLFCGTAVATALATRGHYYAGRGNKFWEFLHVTGMTSERLHPEDDVRLPTFGLGLTDLVKHVAQSHDRDLDFSKTPDLERRLAPHRPTWVAFNGLKAADQAARAFRQPTPRYGVQDWTVGSAQVFVLTSSSGASAKPAWDGRAHKIDWWHDLAELVSAERRAT